jgi:1-pyrroline-5-carboxylate dehydrogenase
VNGIARIPEPVNEPIRNYAPGSPERGSLKKRLDEMLTEEYDIPGIIGGKEVRSGNTLDVVCPHDHGHKLGVCHQVSEDDVANAAKEARKAWQEWSVMPWESRAAIFLKAAELLAGPWRDTINAATMLGQSKTVYQSEIDAAAEQADFWRFNAYFMQSIYEGQPRSDRGIWDYVEYRPLEGFVFAVTPFNFTSIGGNLPSAPAIMGNVSLWKPSSTSLLSNYLIYKVMEAAGLPPGVINFVPGKGRSVGDPVFASKDFAGLHFTGSTATFQAMWRTMAENLPLYASYPRIVGETGGKDFIFAHPSADANAVTTAILRAAYEYQGQKCSAASRAYIPKSLWSGMAADLKEQLAEMKQGSPLDFTNFVCAVIDKNAFDDISDYINEAKNDSSYEIIAGGGCDDSVGYFIEPTLVTSQDPKSRLMREEIFGPVMTVYVYDDGDLDETLELCDTGSDYALTGAIFAHDRRDIVKLTQALTHAAGNFYINDKPTGAVVGQQPFGGGRASGTNDKAGSASNLSRWISQRTVKETFDPPHDYTYPFMGEE